MAKVEQFIQRQDGSEVRIVAESCIGIGLTHSTFVHVQHRKSFGDTWELMGDRPHPDWRKMSVDDYIKHGRPEMFQVASIGEILKVTNALHANCHHD